MWDDDLRKLHNSWKDIQIEHTEEPIYHYTSRIGLDGILKNRQLWANDIYIYRMTNLREFMYWGF